MILYIILLYYDTCSVCVNITTSFLTGVPTLSHLCVRWVMASPTQSQDLVVKWTTDDVVRYLQGKGLDNEITVAFQGKQLCVLTFLSIIQ